MTRAIRNHSQIPETKGSAVFLNENQDGGAREDIALAFAALTALRRRTPLDFSRASWYGARRMHRTSRRVVILVVAVASLGYFVYKFRNSTTVEGFDWPTLGHPLREANLRLLLLALVTISG